MKFYTLIISLIYVAAIYSQDNDLSRDQLISELERTKLEMIQATQSLTDEQWHFKPSEDSWNIAQVLEHMGLYERLYTQEIRIGASMPSLDQSEVSTENDQQYINWMGEPQPHTAPPQAVPQGFMDGKENLAYFLAGRSTLMENLLEVEDLKVKFVQRNSEKDGLRSLHGLLVIHYGHTDRHLRQIERIKNDPNFPKGEHEAIIEAMKAETKAYFSRDYEGWKSRWSQNPNASMGWNLEDGQYVYLRGWDEIHKQFKEDFESTEVVYPDFKYANIDIQIEGDLAMVLYDEYVANKDMKYMRVPERKILEKVNGEWKIHSIYTYWSRKYDLSLSEVDNRITAQD